ncbi:hypothetical protein B0J14DRAFT_691029 [Halenospora varia]|nr:hypothetical protein B0J14DRAFT_691029 [Halenospora varia]
MENWKKKLAARVWVKLEEMNKGGQDHTRISRDMLVIIQDPNAALGKSSKGTVMRGLAERRFAKVIAKADGEDSTENEGPKLVDETSYEEIPRRVRNIVHEFSRLADYIIDLYRNEPDGYSHKRTTTEGGNKEMLNLAQKYSTFGELEFDPVSPGGPEVSQIMGTTVDDDSISLIIRLVRAEYDDEARPRVADSLYKSGKPCLTESGKVLCLVSPLDYEYLDIDSGFMDTICKTTELTIIHAAWNVNFSLLVTSFERHFAGLRNLINVAMTCRLPPKLVFCSSTASVLGSNHPSTISEVISTDPSDSDRLGYSKSKWIAEAICDKASHNEKFKGRFHLVKIGQLTGDMQNGV